MAQLTSLSDSTNVLVTIIPDPGSFTGVQQVTINSIDPSYTILFKLGATADEIEYNGPFLLDSTTALIVSVYDSNAQTLLGSDSFLFTKDTTNEEPTSPPNPAAVTMTATQQESSKQVADRANFYISYHGKIVERTSKVLGEIGTSQGKDKNANQDALSNPDISELNCLNLLSPSFVPAVIALKNKTPKQLRDKNGNPIGFTKVNGPIEHFQNVAGYTQTWTTVKRNNVVLDYYGFYWCAAFVTTCWVEAGAAAPGTDNTGFVHNEINKGTLPIVGGGSTSYYCRTGVVAGHIYWGALHGNFYQPKEIANDPLKVSPGSSVIFEKEKHIEVAVESSTIDGLKTCGGNTSPSLKSIIRNGNGLYDKYYSKLNNIWGLVRPWPYTIAYDYYDNFNQWKNAVESAGYQVSTEIRYNKGSARLRYYRAIKINSNTGEQTWVGGWVRGQSATVVSTPLINKIKTTGMGSLIKPAP